MTFSDLRQEATPRPILLRQEGQTAILALLCMITLCGFVALVASMGRLVIEKIRLQNAADLSAFSGAAVQAAGLNALARLNESIKKDVDYFAEDDDDDDNVYDSKKNAKDEIDKRTETHKENILSIVRSYAKVARLTAGEVAENNFPGATVYQIGVQIDPDSLDTEELRQVTIKNSASMRYWYWKHDHKDKDDSTYTPKLLYHKPLSHTAFWARLEATIKSPALPALFFRDNPDGIVLTADSMASPYDGHTGTPSETDLKNCRPEYRVKFTPINHPSLKFITPGENHRLVQMYPQIVKAGQYVVLKARDGQLRDILAPSIDPSERKDYAH